MMELISGGNPGWRHAVMALALRRYPLLSGAGTVANHRWVRRLAGNPHCAVAWARGPGGPMLVPLDDWVGRAVYFAGDLDPKVSAVCRRLVRPGDACLDIGANIGLVTLLLAELVGSAGRVVAVEPNPANLDLLRQSLARRPVDNVMVQAVALGTGPGTCTLSVPAGNRGAASLVPGRIADPAASISVPVLALDDLPGLHERPLRLMKLDVEGFETQVLAGAERLLRTRPPAAILFEHNDGSPPAASPMVARLRAADYRILALPKRSWRLAMVDVGHPAAAGANDFLALQPGVELGA